jgi:hypothetical protein
MQEKVYFRGMEMLKYLFLFCFLLAMPAEAQMATLNKAKYVTVLKVVANHKMKDKDLASDIDKLRENSKFKQELGKMLEKLDNSRPNDAKNRKIIRILEQAGKDIYNELK